MHDIEFYSYDRPKKKIEKEDRTTQSPIVIFYSLIPLVLKLQNFSSVARISKDVMIYHYAVSALYCGHPRDHDLVS